MTMRASFAITAQWKETKKKRSNDAKRVEVGGIEVVVMVVDCRQSRKVDGTSEALR